MQTTQPCVNARIFVQPVQGKCKILRIQVSVVLVLGFRDRIFFCGDGKHILALRKNSTSEHIRDGQIAHLISTNTYYLCPKTTTQTYIRVHYDIRLNLSW